MILRQTLGEAVAVAEATRLIWGAPMVGDALCLASSTLRITDGVGHEDWIAVVDLGRGQDTDCRDEAGSQAAELGRARLQKRLLEKVLGDVGAVNPVSAWRRQRPQPSL